MKAQDSERLSEFIAGVQTKTGLTVAGVPERVALTVRRAVDEIS